MRHKRGHGEAGTGVQLGLIITPMLDMSFQLMAFFIMTYHPSALEGHIDGNLLPPTLVATKAKGGKIDEKQDMDLPAVDEEPQLQDALLVIIKSVAKGQVEGVFVDGEPSQLMLKRPQDAMPVTVTDTDKLANLFSLIKVDLADGTQKVIGKRFDFRDLTTELKKDAAGKANIKIEGDGNLKHMYLMQVYDACKTAGYQNISFVAPARERKE